MGVVMPDAGGCRTAAALGRCRAKWKEMGALSQQDSRSPQFCALVLNFRAVSRSRSGGVNLDLSPLVAPGATI